MERGQPRWDIVIGGREIKWEKNTISYSEAKETWDKLRENQQVIGDPPISFRRHNGEVGTLRTGDTVKVEDGFEIKIDPSHLS